MNAPTEIAFRVYGKPAPWHVPAQVRYDAFGRARAHHYRAAEHEAWAESVRAQALPYRPPEPWEGEVELRLEFVLCKKKHHPKNARHCRNPRSAAIARAPIIKPDTGKLGRVVEDALTGLFWVDDAQVVRQVFGKRWARGDEPERVEIRARSLAEMGGDANAGTQASQGVDAEGRAAGGAGAGGDVRREGSDDAS